MRSTAVPAPGHEQISNDGGRVARMSLIEEGPEKQVDARCSALSAATKSTGGPVALGSSEKKPVQGFL